jgi:Zn finger protein HypA/HybF involved in hydrogenase expression
MSDPIKFTCECGQEMETFDYHEWFCPFCDLPLKDATPIVVSSSTMNYFGEGSLIIDED